MSPLHLLIQTVKFTVRVAPGSCKATTLTDTRRISFLLPTASMCSVLALKLLLLGETLLVLELLGRLNTSVKVIGLTVYSCGGIWGDYMRV